MFASMLSFLWHEGQDWPNSSKHRVKKKKKGKVKRISHATMYFSLFFIDYLQTCTGNL